MTDPIHPAPSESPLPLEGRRVGLSISDSPDLASLGFGQMHIEDAFVECSRHLLAGGASLAYGGDLRERGYTKILFDVARTHLRSATSPSERIATFLAWPLHLKLTASGRAELKKVAQFFPVGPPEDLRVDQQSYLEPASPESSYVWARCLTRMREMINDHVNARLLLGGKVTGYQGKYPGLAEEAFLAIKRGIPVYLLGGFGGCTRAIIEAVKGDEPAALTADFQLADPNYAAVASVYANSPSDPWDSPRGPITYESLTRFFRERGVIGLNNGLGVEENQRLFTTVYVPEIVSLILKGLMALHHR
jgi:SLOG cluster2